MEKKYLIAIIILIVIVIAGAFLFLSQSDNDGTIKIGYLPSDHDAALFIAEADGLYEEKNITIETVQFNNGGDLMTAMASGKVDIGYVGITPVLSSIEKGVPVKVVSGVQTEGSGIVANKDSGISSVSDLKGKSVATPGEASIQYMLLQYALEKEGLKIDDVSASAMKVAPMNDALNNGKIVAMCTYEPYVTTALKNGKAVEIKSSSEILPNHPCCVVAASDDFIKNKPDVLKDILEIHEKATDSINNDPSAAAEKLPDNIVANVDIEKDALQNINFIHGLDDEYKQDVMDFMNIEIKMGLLKKALTEEQIFFEF